MGGAPQASEPAPPTLAWASDHALRVAFDGPPSATTQARVHALVRAARSAPPVGLVDAVPAYASVLLVFDLDGLDAPRAEAAVRALLDGRGSETSTPTRELVIPTCYEGDCAPDLGEVARLNRLTTTEVVALHAGAPYVVAFLGFSPGFPYLLGLPERLATPRLDRPRACVPAGSVAIAGLQAGVYPQATPGGWRLLGRTPLPLFDPLRNPPTLLQPGDRVRFVPIDRAELEAWRAEGR